MGDEMKLRELMNMEDLNEMDNACIDLIRNIGKLMPLNTIDNNLSLVEGIIKKADMIKLFFENIERHS